MVKISLINIRILILINKQTSNMSFGQRRWFSTILSKAFIRCGVRATGLKWLGSLGCAVLGTGTTQEAFHRIGTLPRPRLMLKNN